jgi:hypothetical protein
VAELSPDQSGRDKRPGQKPDVNALSIIASGQPEDWIGRE